MKQAPRQTLTAPIRRIRFVYVASFFCFWVAMIVLRNVESQAEITESQSADEADQAPEPAAQGDDG